MYHSRSMAKDSPIKSGERRSVGRSSDRDLEIAGDSVSRHHASVEVTQEGYLAVTDEHSSNGTWLHRSGQWIRIHRAILGTGDRLRFGEEEVALEKLVGLFGKTARVRLREGDEMRTPPRRYRTATKKPNYRQH